MATPPPLWFDGRSSLIGGWKCREITTTLSEKKEEASNVSKQRDKGWIHVIRVHYATHLAVTTTRQGN